MHRHIGGAVWFAVFFILIGVGFDLGSIAGAQQEPVNEKPDFDQQVRRWAEECQAEIESAFQSLLETGGLTEVQLFDTFYIPIPGTYPQKYHTQYDIKLDNTIQGILDRYLKKDRRIVFVVAVDRNGYLPTHNSRYSLPLTGDREHDIRHNRTKRLFNDRTGLAAARNTKAFLLQQYNRDTGEVMFDLSVPLFIRDRHWGAVRFGYTHR